jgi:hypothetical protein
MNVESMRTSEVGSNNGVMRDNFMWHMFLRHAALAKGAGSEVFTAMAMKIFVFRDMTIYSFLKMY